MNLFDYFSQITIAEAVLFGVFMVALVVQVYMYLHFYTGIIRHKKRVKKQHIPTNNEQPPVSVIICAKNELDNLAAFLPLVLEQDYPQYEGIGVNDGSRDEKEVLVKDLKERYAHL